MFGGQNAGGMKSAVSDFSGGAEIARVDNVARRSKGRQRGSGQGGTKKQGGQRRSGQHGSGEA